MRTNSGFTLVEMLIVVAVIGIIAAVALPGLTRARMAANESSAIGSMRAVNSGQHAFRFTCGGGNFAPNLQNLGLPINGAPGYVSPDLGQPGPVVKSGYEIDMSSANPSAIVSCNGGTTGTSYHVTADPLPGRGTRHFGTNSPAAIFQSTATLVGVMPDDGAPPPPAIPLQR